MAVSFNDSLYIEFQGLRIWDERANVEHDWVIFPRSIARILIIFCARAKGPPPLLRRALGSPLMDRAPVGGERLMDTISLKATVVAGKDQVACPLLDEVAILHMGSGIYYGLDPVGARIWQLVQQPRSIEEIRAKLVDEYDVDPARCENDLLEILKKLRDEHLIEIRDS